MKKTNFILTAAFAAMAIFTSAISAFGQETLIPGSVQDEQKLMVTVRLKINDNQVIRVEKQEGFLLYPQTVITTMSPLMILGARTTVISQGQEVPAFVYLDFNVGPNLAALILVRPFSISIDTKKTNFFSENEFGENTFILTSQSVTDVKDLKEDARGDYLRGAVAVDDHGALLGIVSMVEKNDAGTLEPRMIPFFKVEQFIDFFQKGAPIPEMPENKPEDSKKISLDKI